MFCIIDGNSIGHQAQAAKPLTVGGREVQAVYQSLRTVKYIKRYNPEYKNILWLWDGHAKFRYDILPEYKGQRDDNPQLRELRKKYKSVKPLIEEALSYLGVAQVRAKDFEADDLAGLFVRRATSKKSKTKLITGDQDWQQLVNPYTTWHDQRRNRDVLCTYENFEEITGVRTPKEFLEVKALQGDSSDNIPGVGGIGSKTAVAIIKCFGSVRGLLEAYKLNGEFEKEDLPEDLRRARKKINEFCKSGIKAFTFNYRLMNLQTDVRDEEMAMNMKVTRKPKDMEAFRGFCREYNFLSILRDFENWDKSF